MVPPQGQVIIIQTKPETSPADDGTKSAAVRPDKATQLKHPGRTFRHYASFAGRECQPIKDCQGLVFQTGSVVWLEATQPLTAIAQVRRIQGNTVIFTEFTSMPSYPNMHVCL